ncbi:MAG: hypothetical protein GF400_02765 [Candidatus Eisenbacteria bacterium]|nr:hypothetical protein [Candidatus Eisenbacteria bacterium]
MSSIGDIVLTEPVVTAIRRGAPRSTVGFVVKRRYRELVRPNPDVDRVHVLRDSSPGALLELGREIRRERYSAVVDLHANPRSFFLSAGSGAPARTTYRKRGPLDSLRVRFLSGTYRTDRKLVARYLEALGPLGIPHPYERPRFHLDAAARGRAQAMLSEAGFAGTAFAVVAPGSVWETKRWPADRFAEVSRRVGSELGMRVLVLGSASERDLCERVAAGSDAVCFAGAASLGESAALVAEASLFVGNDSGPTHISMALDVPTVAIFGPTDPGQFDFRGHALVYAGLPCSACSFYGGRRCRRGHWNCMLDLGVERVMEAAAGLLLRRGKS